MIDRPPTHIFDLLAATAAPGEGRSIVNAWAFLGLIASLLFVFFLAVTLLAILRRHRRSKRSSRATKTAASVDPWREAGRRAQPYRSTRGTED